MAGRGQIAIKSSALIAMIGDEDTITGFLLAGVGNVDLRRKTNYLIVDSSENIMEGNACECWEETSENEDCVVDQDDEDNYYTSSFMSKLQFRKDISKARWNNEKGMAVVVEKKGKMWMTTGIVRNGNTYCSIEETLFLAEIGALQLVDDNDLCLSLKDIYEKVAKEKTGCYWELFEVYRHLKSLGYIIGRHGVPWTMKITKVKDVDNIADLGQGTPKRNGVVDMEPKEESSIVDLFNNMEINEVRPDFDVYLPNRKFKKSSPGNPSFVLHLTRDHPPSKGEIDVLERQCCSIPLKFCHVDHGRVSFFSFDRMELPVLL